MLATATAFTAETIANAYRRFLPKLPDEVILCGGALETTRLSKCFAAASRRPRSPQWTISE